MQRWRALEHIITPPSHNQWAAGGGNYLWIVRLKGVAAETSPANRAFAE